MIVEQRKLVRWFLRMAQLADRQMMGHRDRTLNDPIDDIECPGFNDANEARSWFSHSRRNLFALLELASSRGWYFEVWSLAEAMSAYFVSGGGSSKEAEQCYSFGIKAAKADNNRSAQARLLLLQGQLYTELGDYGAATVALDEVVRISDEIGSRPLRGVGFDLKGHLFQKIQKWDSARIYFERAIEITRQEHQLGFNVRRTLAFRLRSLAQAQFKLGRSEVASRYLDEARELFSQAGDWRNAVVVEIDSARLSKGNGESSEERYASAIRLGLDIGLELSNSDRQWYEWFQARSPREGARLGFPLIDA